MVKNLPAHAGDVRDADSISGSGRSLEEGLATPSNIFAWRTPWDRGAWQALGPRVTKSQARRNQLSTHAYKELNILVIWQGS